METENRNPAWFSLLHPDFSLHGSTPAPVLNDRTEGLSDRAPEVPSRHELLGKKGAVWRSVVSGRGFRIERERFEARDRSLWGLRLKIRNTGTHPFALTRLTPLSIEGSEGLVLKDARFSDWRVLRMARHKNDIPGVFRPARRDADTRDAQFSSHDVVAGRGVRAEEVSTVETENRVVSSEPCLLIRGADRRPGLFIGFLGQTEHLSRLDLTPAPTPSLESLDAVCEFDNVPLAPGESRRTHWLLLAPYDDEPAMLARFADWLAERHGIPRPGPAPSIYCSWYFYGREITEADLHENLAALRKRPVPFDVLMIDDGWSDFFGSWNANAKWPRGMADAARRIREAGFAPGLWTCPFVVMAASPVLQKFPGIVARDASGAPSRFGYQGPPCYVVDVTAPDAEDYFQEVYGRIREWGFTHHKFDFLRAVVAHPGIRFHQASLTRAQVYRLGLERVRNALGKDAYILACGGLFEGSAGLADGMRIGTDTRGSWRFDGYAKGRPTALITAKQNVFRAYTNRLWHTDPDAALIRLRDKPFHPDVPDFSLGDFSDEEAFAVILNQYIGGGIACISERFAELSEPRRLLWRHALPVGVPPARMLDPHHPDCPTLFLTAVTPADPALEPWWTLAIFNFDPAPVRRNLGLGDLPIPAPPEGWLVTEFRTRRFFGVQSAEARLALDIPARGARLLRLAPWSGKRPVLAGTDLHFSGGGLELANLQIGPDSVSGKLVTRWTCPVDVAAAFPTPSGPVLRNVRVSPGDAFVVNVRAS